MVGLAMEKEKEALQRIVNELNDIESRIGNKEFSDGGFQALLSELRSVMWRLQVLIWKEKRKNEQSTASVSAYR
jgi:hypothetical protein